jgi:leucyl/phenylalanyl-tRNA--protein transferase
MTGRAPRIAWISKDDPPDAFPPVDQAFEEPNGLLAAGGDLSADRLLYAYSHGIFPWYDEGQPILWWSPDPRCVLHPDEFHVAKRLRRSLKSSTLEVSFNNAFGAVIDACAEHRDGQAGTWITADMKKAFQALHKAGFAHSVEVWQGNLLVGGLYGLAIGRVFFGESMFSLENNASKAAMLALCEELRIRDVELLDCQVVSPHLVSLGARLMHRSDFAKRLEGACEPGTLLELPGNLRRPAKDFLSQ